MIDYQKNKTVVFKLNSKTLHLSCITYDGERTCQDLYIGETKRNVEIRLEEHQDTSKDSKLAKL